MVKIGKLNLENKSAIAVAISDKENNRLIKASTLDILEIRVDQFKKINAQYIKNSILLRKKLGIPIILTIRSKEEGGNKRIANELKWQIFKQNMPLIDAVDIELRSAIIAKVIRLAKENKKAVIVSWHDLKATPDARHLYKVLMRAKKKGAGIVKIAALANNLEDVLRLMDFTQKNRSKKIITISMGRIGVISRILFPAMGSLITYSYLHKPSGPGQLPLPALNQHMRRLFP